MKSNVKPSIQPGEKPGEKSGVQPGEKPGEKSGVQLVRTDALVHDFIKRDEAGNPIGTFRALDGVSIQSDEGAFIAVLGHNGSGKSTLAKHLNAMLTPTEGSVWVGEMDTRDEACVWDIRKTAGMVFQNPDNQIIATVVDEDVGFGPENLGVPTVEILKRVEDCLRAVDIWHLKDFSVSKLSGGQKQLVAIAGVLAMEPKCIVLDEATAMLDPSGRREVLDATERLRREKRIATILITHNTEEVLTADRIYITDHGHVVAEGTPREVFSDVGLLERYCLKVPQIILVAEELRRRGYDLGRGILTRAELVVALCRLRGDPACVSAALRSAAPAAPAAPAVSAAPAAPAVSAATPVSAGIASADSAAADPAAPAEPAAPDVKAVSAASAAGTASSKPPILSAEHLSFAYSPGTALEKLAVRDVSFEIAEGEFIGIIGHTGSGKSTLIRHLNGLIVPTSGTVRFLGRDINAEGFSGKDLRRQVGMVFQYPEYQLFEIDVLTDVAFGPKNLGYSEAEARAKAAEALSWVGLDESVHSVSPFDLSGGQKRRAAIAGVLAMDPQVLILDEPAAGLDAKAKGDLLDRLKILHAEKNLTVILVSHNMEDVAEYADRILVMGEGSLVMDAPPHEVFSCRRELEKLGLAAPEVAYLMDDLRSVGFAVSGDVISVEEALAEIIRALGPALTSATGDVSGAEEIPCP